MHPGSTEQAKLFAGNHEASLLAYFEPILSLYGRTINDLGGGLGARIRDEFFSLANRLISFFIS